jgi:hypothetical protein
LKFDDDGFGGTQIFGINGNLSLTPLIDYYVGAMIVGSGYGAATPVQVIELISQYHTYVIAQQGSGQFQKLAIDQLGWGFWTAGNTHSMAQINADGSANFSGDGAGNYKCQIDANGNETLAGNLTLAYGKVALMANYTHPLSQLNLDGSADFGGDGGGNFNFHVGSNGSVNMTDLTIAPANPVLMTVSNNTPIYLAAPVDPVNVVAWTRISINGNVYFMPLYQ